LSPSGVLFGKAGSFQGEPKITMIAQGKYRNKSIGEIRGTGYVVESLEAALWCFHQTDSFEAAILKAANLGDDADTTAAICGQVAGAFYGESGIPKNWLEKLTMREQISALAYRLFVANKPT
jgi:ADP-ribosylglycohydrolase